MHAKNLSLASVNVPRHARNRNHGNNALGTLTDACERNDHGKKRSELWSPAALFLVACSLVAGPVRTPDTTAHDFWKARSEALAMPDARVRMYPHGILLFVAQSRQRVQMSPNAVLDNNIGIVNQIAGSENRRALEKKFRDLPSLAP